MIRKPTMKTIVSLSALSLACASLTAPAFADHHGPNHQDDHHQERDDHSAHGDHAAHDDADHHAAHNHGGHDHGSHAEESAEAAAATPTEGGVTLSRTPEIETALAAGGAPVVVEVLGVVCDFCAKAMNKTFGKRDDVSAVYVDLDHKTLNLVLTDSAAMPDKELDRLVKRAGYRVKAIHRGDTVLAGPHASDPA